MPILIPGDFSSRATHLLYAGASFVPEFSQATAVAVHFAGRLSLIAFATAAARGVLAGWDFQGSLQTALISLGVFYGLGLVLGDLARRVVEENAQTEVAVIINKTMESQTQAA